MCRVQFGITTPSTDITKLFGVSSLDIRLGSGLG